MTFKSLIKRALSAAGYEVHKSGTLPSTWVPPGHFYSPIVDINELQRDRARVFNTDRDVPGIAMNECGQLQTLTYFRKFYHELPFGPAPSESLLYYYENNYYGYGDAIVLACMLRLARPKRLIEFGAGFSSCATLDVNRLFLDNAMHCTFIDPNPGRLQALLTAHHESANIIKSRAQDVDRALLSALEPNDVVFIDSTHVVKAGGDVNFHIFELLPCLVPGVLIHFHDVFYPFEYPECWFFDENRSWNETYLLRAFLTDNHNYEIVFFNDFMRAKHAAAFAKILPPSCKDTGGAFWLRKLR